MRDPERISPLLTALEAYWNDHPDLRLGQILSNIGAKYGFEEPFYMEDECVERFLRAEGYLDE